jgi:hypothetical protein
VLDDALLAATASDEFDCTAAELEEVAVLVDDEDGAAAEAVALVVWAT